MFYGWLIVGAAFVVMMLGFGVAYGFAAFYPSIQAEFAANRGDVALVFSLSGFLYFGLGAVSGPLADRTDPRWTITGGMVLVAAGLVLAARADALWQIYLGYSLAVGIGIGFSYVPAIGTVQRWFFRRRGMASGLAVSGIGVGTLVMPPFAAWLVSTTDWRTAYLVLALLTAVFGGGAGLLMLKSPALRGLEPDGGAPLDAPLDPTVPAGASAGMGLAASLRSKPFALMSVAALTASFGMFIPFVHISAYAVDQGHDPAMGIALVSLIGLGSIIGRFVLGGAADRIGRRPAFLAMFVGLTMVMLFWLVSTAAWALILFAVMFGTFYGGFVALAPALAADFFGGRNISGIIGVLYSTVAVGTLFGPYLAGLAFDLTGSYFWPILVAAALNAVAVGCIMALPDPSGWRDAGVALPAR